MPSWLQHISGHHIVILIVIVSGIWNWASKVVAENAKKRRAEQLKRENEEALLRSGKSSVSVQASAPTGGSFGAPGGGQQLDPRRMLEEIAARRQRQLEELRRKQTGGAGSPQQAQVRAPARQSPAPLPQAPAGTMSPEQYNQQKRRQAQLEADRLQRLRAQQATAKSDEAKRQVQVRADSRTIGPSKRGKAMDPAAQAAMLRERDRLEREDQARAAQAAKTRAAAQAEPAAEVAHTRGGSSVGISKPMAAGIMVLGQSLDSRRDWRRMMALQAILGPSVSSRDINGLADPLRS